MEDVIERVKTKLEKEYPIIANGEKIELEQKF